MTHWMNRDQIDHGWAPHWMNKDQIEQFRHQRSQEPLEPSGRFDDLDEDDIVGRDLYDDE